MADTLTFPQHGDEPDASFFSKLVRLLGPGVIEYGLGFQNVDYAGLTFDVAGGTAYIVRSTMSTASSDIEPQKTIEGAVMVVQYPGTTDVALEDNAVNHVYLDANVANDDSATIAVNTTGNPPADAVLKIGEIDTAEETASDQWYLVANDGTLTFPTEAAIDSEDAAGRLREGTTVFDRETDTQYVITA